MFYNVSRTICFVNGRMQLEMRAQSGNGCIGPGGSGCQLRVLDSARTESSGRFGRRAYVVDRFDLGDEDHDPSDEVILTGVKDAVKALLDYGTDDGMRNEILSFGTVDEIEIAVLRELRAFLGLETPDEKVKPESSNGIF